MTAVATTRRRALPAWLGGVKVSPLAYRIVCVAFGNPPKRPSAARRTGRVTPGIDRTRLVEVVDHLTLVLDVDEYDVLLALGELKREGVFEVNDR